MLFFISGTGRCGSTVVTELLARHSNVGFVFSNVDDKLSRLDLSGRWNDALFRPVAVVSGPAPGAVCARVRGIRRLVHPACPAGLEAPDGCVRPGRASSLPSNGWTSRIENLAADRRGQVAAVLKFVELDWSSEFEAGFSRHGFDSGRGQAFRMVWTRTPRASSTAAFVATWRPGATGRAFYR